MYDQWCLMVQVCSMLQVIVCCTNQLAMEGVPQSPQQPALLSPACCEQLLDQWAPGQVSTRCLHASHDAPCSVRVSAKSFLDSCAICAASCGTTDENQHFWWLMSELCNTKGPEFSRYVSQYKQTEEAMQEFAIPASLPQSACTVTHTWKIQDPDPGARPSYT